MPTAVDDTNIGSYQHRQTYGGEGAVLQSEPPPSAPFYPIKRHQTGEKQKRTRTGANTKRFDAIPSCAKRSGRLERALYPEIW
ncbi:hypothetical protein CTAM01_15050 [Colletotrichum tamarilloi]|uniref:Uncharacterized protein n=1 Tax=Colletotrichum tamarilloi TaxID=1209934 RepID=A0ABQ9QME7_9PEZI|nr:uncharacterized protein CTAM01_15050 [Colletotrichum tamarilloi]KAK1478248.1 hypothetical protein CTAM01_15050 [Colletotrichum tamarilloi]